MILGSRLQALALRGSTAPTGSQSESHTSMTTLIAHVAVLEKRQGYV